MTGLMIDHTVQNAVYDWSNDEIIHDVQNAVYNCSKGEIMHDAQDAVLAGLMMR